MTTPVSSANSSVYDPSAQMSFADGRNAAVPSSGPTASAASPAPNVVTIDPVLIEGDAGAQQLVQRYEQSRRAPDCSLEAKEAALSCAEAAATAVAGGLSATTVVGALPAAAVVLAQSVTCGKDLSEYFACEDK